MKVTVHIIGELATSFGHDHIVELEQGSTITTMTTKISERKGSKRQGYLGRYRLGENELTIMINGRNIHLLNGTDTVLHDGDQVTILPPSAGG